MDDCLSVYRTLLAHPLFWRWPESYAAWRAAALDMGLVTVAAASWLLAYRRDFVWRHWLFLAFVGGAVIAAAAWEAPGFSFWARTATAWWPLPLVLLALLPSLRRGRERPLPDAASRKRAGTFRRRGSLHECSK